MRPSHREWVTDGYNARSWCVCVLQLLAAGLALLIKVTGNGLAWMFRALSLSPVISSQLESQIFSLFNFRARAKITFYVWASVYPVWRRCSSFPYRGVCAVLVPCQTGASTPQHKKFFLRESLGSSLLEISSPGPGLYSRERWKSGGKKSSLASSLSTGCSSIEGL